MINEYAIKVVVWIGTEIEYNDIAVKDPDVMYIITEDIYE